MEFDFPAADAERRPYIVTTFLETLHTHDFSRRLRLIARVTFEEASELRKILYDAEYRRAVENEFAAEFAKAA